MNEAIPTLSRQSARILDPRRRSWQRLGAASRLILSLMAIPLVTSPTRAATDESNAREHSTPAVARFVAVSADAGAEKARSAIEVRANKRRVAELLREADGLYRAKKLSEARDVWGRILELDPNHKGAKVMLEETEKEYGQRVAAGLAREKAEAAERAAEERLDTPVPLLKTAEPIPLSEFMQTLSLASGIDFSLSEGADMKVSASFVDKTPREILDAVLLPAGLKWERRRSNTVVVRPDLVARSFNLNEEETAKVSALIDNRSLQKMLWGPSGEKPLRDTNLQLDARRRVLLVRDSEENARKLEAFLSDLKRAQPVELVTRLYRIDPQAGPQIKATVEAVLGTERTPYDLERSVHLDGSNLIVRDTSDHVEKVEELLRDKGFMSGLTGGKLEIATFSLIPREALRGDTELARTFAEQTKEVVETFLYAEGGIAKAQAEGRRMWFDSATLQLTITDYPENVRRVAAYIDALPQIKSAMLTKTIPLKHVLSSEMVSDVQDALSLERGEEAAELTVTKTLRTEQEIVYRDLTIRLLRVNQNAPEDKLDDSCELIVRTGTQRVNVTLAKYDSQFIDDYEILAEDVRPAGESGTGNATLRIRYIPPAEPGSPPAR